jgi:SAM-dependent methyltransferase
MGTYAYDQSWQEERRRLAGMAALWDAGTFPILERLGIGPGWRCIDIGAGAGTVTEWLADKVGEEGKVVSADVFTRYLEGIDRPNVEVREWNVLSDDPPGEFDLVYSRLVAEHLGRPAVERMVALLAPGGYLVLEDYLFQAAAVNPEDEVQQRVVDAVLTFMSRAGFDQSFGMRVPALMRELGLVGVGAEGRARISRGGDADLDFSRLSLGSLRDAIVAEGLVSEEDCEYALALLENPDATYVSPLMIASWGRRPA